MKRVVTVVGARPQFIKAAMLSGALARVGIEEILVHTGQHYDVELSDVFFRELDLPAPDVNLAVGSGSHAEQTGATMVRLEGFLRDLNALPDSLIVFGDTNATLAGALVASKLGIELVHVEAGLRSFNRRMPEEINRIVADRLASRLFCPSRTAVEHLAREGIRRGVAFTGDLMFDAVLAYRSRALELVPVQDLVDETPDHYVLATLHRAETTDDPDRLARALRILGSIPVPVVWPMHPRTRSRLETFALTVPDSVRCIQPVSYLGMLSLLQGASHVLTDSGGLQKEAYWLSRPCITLRTETEWVETLEGGWNHVTDLDEEKVAQAYAARPSGAPKPWYGSGTAADVMSRALLEGLSP